MLSDPYQPGDRPEAYGDRLVQRVYATEYNLAEQRGDQRQAGLVLGRMIGFFLSKLSRQ